MIPGNLTELRKRNLLDKKGHPIVKAYMIACRTMDDSCSMVKDLWEHAEKCKLCSQRGERALNLTYGKV